MRDSYNTIKDRKKQLQLSSKPGTMKQQKSAVDGMDIHSLFSNQFLDASSSIPWATKTKSKQFPSGINSQETVYVSKPVIVMIGISEYDSSKDSNFLNKKSVLSDYANVQTKLHHINGFDFIYQKLTVNGDNNNDNNNGVKLKRSSNVNSITTNSSEYSKQNDEAMTNSTERKEDIQLSNTASGNSSVNNRISKLTVSNTKALKAGNNFKCNWTSMEISNFNVSVVKTIEKSDYDGLIYIISSHMDNNCTHLIYDSNCQEYPYDYIFDLFNNSKCKQLNKKAKLFILEGNDPTNINVQLDIYDSCLVNNVNFDFQFKQILFTNQGEKKGYEFEGGKLISTFCKNNNSRRFTVKNKKHRTKRGKRSKPGSLRTTPSTSKASQDTIESVNSTNLDDIKEGTIKDIISDSNKDNGINTSCTDTSEDENDGNSRGNIRDWTYQDICDWLKRELLNDSTIKNETIDKIMLKFEMIYIAGHVLLVLDQELLESIGIETENIRQKILALTQPKLKQQHVPQISQEIHAINDDTNSNLNASSSLTTIANTITSTKTNQSGTAGKTVTTDKAKCINNDEVEKNEKTLDSIN